MDPLIAEHNRAWEDLWERSRGRSVEEVERLLRVYAKTYAPHARETDLVLQARVMSDKRWGLKHPVAALALAWRLRRVRSPRRTLAFFLRPRSAG